MGHDLLGFVLDLAGEMKERRKDRHMDRLGELWALLEMQQQHWEPQCVLCSTEEKADSLLNNEVGLLHAAKLGGVGLANLGR